MSLEDQLERYWKSRNRSSYSQTQNHNNRCTHLIGANGEIYLPGGKVNSKRYFDYLSGKPIAYESVFEDSRER